MVAYSVQQTLVLPALPALQHTFHTSATWASWTVSLFLVVSCVANPLLGRLGDAYGRRRLLLFVLGLFLVGSVLATASTSIWMLVLARAVQGAGGAVVPLSAAIIRDRLPDERVGFAIGVLFSIMAATTVLGFACSGLVVDHLGWRWLFALAVPPLLAAVGLLWWYLPESPAHACTRPDVPGALLLSLALVAGLVALTEGTDWGWTGARTLGLLGAFALLLLIWSAIERRTDEPLVDLRLLFRCRVFLTNACAFGLGGATFCAFTLMPRFAETVPAATPGSYGVGASATEVGLLMAPGFVLGLAAGPLCGLLGRRVGPGLPLLLGASAMAVGCVALAMWNRNAWQVAIAMIPLGVGWAGAMASLSVATLASVEGEHAGLATGITQVARQVGGAIGTQVGAAILVASASHGTPSAHAYEVVFLLGAAAAAAAALVAPFAGARRAPARPAPASP